MTKIPGVFYIRMSTDEQETSPDQQRGDLGKLAAEWDSPIVGEYLDEGISGDSKKRQDFDRLIRDAQAGKFKRIFCWDQDRFSRFDPLTANHYFYLLRMAGVQVITRRQGLLDFDSLAGFLTASVTQHAKHQFLIDLSANIVRAKNRCSAKGDWGTRCPYAYKRAFYNAAGEFQQMAPDGGKKPFKTWYTRLLPSEDGEAETVKWIFKTFLEKACTVRWLADALNSKGVAASTTGKRWRATVVRYLLTNPAYAGHTFQGRQKRGKFSAMECATVRDTHPAIVSQDLFDEVQERLASRATKGARTASAEYVLSGILKCGCCGGPMCGRSRNVKGYSYRFYACSRYSNTRECPNGHLVRADLVEGKLLDWLKQNVLDESNFATVTEELVTRAKQRQTPAEQRKLGTMQKQLEKLTAQITRATENILLVDDEDIPAAKRALSDWKDKRDLLRQDIDRATAPMQDGKAMVARAMKLAKDLGTRLKAKDALSRREVFRQVFERVTLHLSVRKGVGKGRTGKPKKDWGRLLEGVIDLPVTDRSPSVA